MVVFYLFKILKKIPCDFIFPILPMFNMYKSKRQGLDLSFRIYLTQCKENKSKASLIEFPNNDTKESIHYIEKQSKFCL